MRVKSLFGISNRDSVDSFFQQLDKNENFVVGMHWREYTLSEACELLEKMGFEIIDKYYYADLSKLTIFNFIKYIPYLISSFKPFYVVQARKINECKHEFTISEST